MQTEETQTTEQIVDQIAEQIYEPTDDEMAVAITTIALHFDAMQSLVWQWAEAKGWTARPVDVPEQAALVMTELAEVVEAWRNNEPTSWTDENGKPQGVASEYADAVIRILHYCSLLTFTDDDGVEGKVSLGYEIVRKMAYNWTRAHRHGGKRG